MENFGAGRCFVRIVILTASGFWSRNRSLSSPKQLAIALSIVAFASPAKRQSASVTGLAQLVEDEKMIQKLWRPELKSYFPKGLEEPDLALLRVDIHHAEAWDYDTKV